ncbi:hypothetical protein [Actinomadura alba]|uniref:Uncharacterized protein n=1 Tax=Actinomadura alba TaxID=406431 RepID=A0ABR7M1Z0_9ACTN|nr:hypothetical protein [Actinomadura alba]MBC6470593.1 hypothetical protein [Actinomadura alba]
MNTDEFRNLLNDRTERAHLRPVPHDDLRDRIRVARMRRFVAVTGSGVAVAVGTAVIMSVPESDHAATVATGRTTPTAERTLSPQEMRDIVAEVQANQDRLALESRYRWNRLPGRSDLAWPDERNARLEIRPGQRRLGLYATCDGFESNVNVTITLTGATFPPEFSDGDGRSTGFNCFKGGLYELTIPRSTKKITVTVVAKQYAAQSHPEWPPSRPRTWSFGFYEKGAKVPADHPATDGRSGLPGQVVSVDHREATEATRRLTRRLQERAAASRPSGTPN